MEHVITHLRQDAKIKPLIESIQLSPLSEDEAVYDSLLKAIVSQQLSVKAADTIYKRFLALLGESGADPERVLQLTEDQLRGVGFSRQKAAYVQNVADRARRDKWHTIDWNSRDDEDVLEYLTQIKGVGRWTVQMILIFSLRRPDIFPVDDLGIQKAMVDLYGVDMTVKTYRNQLHEIADAWQPYRSYASRYLWDWKDNQ
jgi:DNA-3-methyladenine glycosylase II